MGQIGNTSIIGEILMNPYISGQNSAKLGGGGGIYRLAETVSDGKGKNVPTKVSVRYLVQMLEDIKGVLDLAQSCQII